jgi:NFACT N-terminal and middle domains
MKITIGKCWQSDHGSLLFQCSTHDGKERRKGFLELSPTSPQGPVVFTEDKPKQNLTAGGIATLIRKHLPTGSLTMLALSEPSTDDHGTKHEFLRLRLQGKSSSGQNSELLIIISTRPDREINVILDTLSIARFREKAKYTVPKKAIAEHLAAVDLDPSGFDAWVRQCFITTNEISQTPKNESPSADGLPSTLPLYQRAARDRVARRLKTLKKTVVQDQSKIPDRMVLDSAKKDAELLRSFIWMVKPESFELTLEDTQTGDGPRTIKLDPDLSAGANLEAAFIKIKKLERAMALGQPRVTAMAADIQRFERALETLRDPATKYSEHEVLTILRDLRLERKPAQEAAKHPVKHLKASHGRCFQVLAGSYIVLGRNAEESDLVVKSSKSQDWWLHVAGGGHGSHVIIAGGGFKDRLPPNMLRAAGILALHFSDRSTSREGEVYVARRHQIKKRKGAAAGLWQIDRAESIVIRYEPDELAVIFSKEIRDGVQRPNASVSAGSNE